MDPVVDLMWQLETALQQQTSTENATLPVLFLQQIPKSYQAQQTTNTQSSCPISKQPHNLLLLIVTPSQLSIVVCQK